MKLLEKIGYDGMIYVRMIQIICIIKGSLVEKLPSYGDLKMQRVQYSQVAVQSNSSVTAE